MTNLTHTDIDLAKVYFEILVGLAKSNPGQTIEYGELVKIAKAKHPGNAAVKGATAVSAGRRLGTLREKFTSPHKLPDLSALVLNKATKNNGDGYNRTFDGEAVRAEISAFDWNTVQNDFEYFVATEKMAVEERLIKQRRSKKVKEDVARQIWWEYYDSSRATIGMITHAQKEAIIHLIMKGFEAHEALNQVCFVQA